MNYTTILTLWVLAFVLLFCLDSCSGGGSSSPTISNSYPNQVLKLNVNRIAIQDTSHEFFSTITLEFKFKSSNYFRSNPNGHFVIGIRTDTDQLAKYVLGQGLVFGNVSGAEDGNPLYPSVQLESWQNNQGSLRQNYLLPPGLSTVLLEDEAEYTVVLISRVQGDNKTLNYSVRKGQELVYTSGTVQDPNRYFNTANDGLFIAEVFGSGKDDWGIQFSEIKVNKEK